MKKVYCKNCIYCAYKTDWDWCDVKLEKGQFIPFIISDKTRETHRQKEFNSKGECSYYNQEWSVSCREKLGDLWNKLWTKRIKFKWVK